MSMVTSTDAAIVSTGIDLGDLQRAADFSGRALKKLTTVEALFIMQTLNRASCVEGRFLQ